MQLLPHSFDFLTTLSGLTFDFLRIHFFYRFVSVENRIIIRLCLFHVSMYTYIPTHHHHPCSYCLLQVKVNAGENEYQLEMLRKENLKKEYDHYCEYNTHNTKVSS